MAPIFYAPFREDNIAVPDFTIYVRAESGPSEVIQHMQSALFDLDSTLAFSDIASMREEIRESVWAERLTAALGLILSVLSGLMAATGLYGVLSFDASRRYREVGIRLAVGARAEDLTIMFAKEALAILDWGLLLGLATHLFLKRYISPFLFGVGPVDPFSILSAILLFGLISVIAAYAPIRKATAVSPAIVLKE
jgi:ABC-type antimicrobial peptide transport system permease subunit